LLNAFNHPAFRQATSPLPTNRSVLNTRWGLGWLGFGGKVSQNGGVVVVKPLDAFRTRIYLAPLGLWLTLDSGKFDTVELNLATRTVRIGLAATTRFTSQARLRVEQPARVSGVGAYQVSGGRFESDRNAFSIRLGSSTTWLELSPVATATYSGLADAFSRDCLRRREVESGWCGGPRYGQHASSVPDR